MSDKGGLGARPAYRPGEQEVSALIDRARRHRLGIEFLSEGALDAVAATFGVHAFAVEAARTELLKEPEPARVGCGTA